MVPPQLSAYPFSHYFLYGYLSKNSDPLNFPPTDFPAIFERYEELFGSALRALGITKAALKNRSEFDFDSGDATNLESGIAVLRAVNALQLQGFHGIELIKPSKTVPRADLICEKNGQKVCVEVKAITKQSSGRPGLFIVDQLHPKISESISWARKQLETSAAELKCTVKLFVCVVNWFAQSIYMDQEDYQQVVNKLEKFDEEESLKGIDGVFFVTKMGQQFLFLNERGKLIDSPGNLSLPL